ncbi:MAG: flavin reductase [Bacteroidota bacterium]|nr:flavin reductase [Bacteroidota bacterium]
MYFSKEDIENLSRVKRLNIINSITGIKPGNLIGSKSLEGHTNLAIFSSVVHLGSHPALIGFFLRPSTKIRRDTYENILETGSYTINHIDKRIIEKAHYSSVKFSSYVSEFEKLKLTEQYINNFYAPYLLESKIKIGLSFVEEVDVKINGTKLIIGEIRHIYLPENIMSEEGYLNLEKSASVGIGGLNSYYNLNFNAEFPYARIENLPNFDED